MKQFLCFSALMFLLAAISFNTAARAGEMDYFTIYFEDMSNDHPLAFAVPSYDQLIFVTVPGRVTNVTCMGGLAPPAKNTSAWTTWVTQSSDHDDSNYGEPGGTTRTMLMFKVVRGALDNSSVVIYSTELDGKTPDKKPYLLHFNVAKPNAKL